MALLCVVPKLSAETGVKPITSVPSIRSLSREEAAKALPVKLTGVVTFLGWEDFAIHDGNASIFADFRFSKARGFWKGPIPESRELAQGSVVEVEGVTDPGGFSPMVLVTKFRRIGDGALPSPIRPSMDKLLSSSLNSQWVEVEGVVRKHSHGLPGPDCLTLVVGGHSCPVLLSNRSQRTPAQLVDAKVRVRGVVLDLANLRSQVAGLKIHSNGDQDIEILVPPSDDPFQAPKVALNRLIPFDPNAELGHRKVSSGVVTFAVPGRFFYL
ncbi:MAG: hypothetical protein RLZZ214_3736, partial [Verrucomicrobiota bacterium]